MSEAQTMSFTTEVKQLLQLMIHSLYSNKEIFLRELISNAADAIDKLRFLESTGQVKSQVPEAQIKISFDKGNLYIEDTGIGMSRDEVIENIGTIARSGTKKFLEEAKTNLSLIGQFGVGFYSAFIVADEVSILTRKVGEDNATLWKSKGDGEFKIEESEKAETGSKITLHLKDDSVEFADNWRLRSLIKQYSNHISVPIKLLKPNESSDAEFETINQAKALWTRPKSEIKDEEYREFYKSSFHDYHDPLVWSHSKVEGRQEYAQLLFIPSSPPFDLYERQARQSIKLYVKRVFIMDDSEKLLPAYLRFVRGVIDSEDLPLNISREILQSSKDIASIRSGSAKKVLSMLEDLTTNSEKYQTFWNIFGAVFKEGIGEDFSNKDKILKLCRFNSTISDDDVQSRSLDDYISAMKEGQKSIFYITADSPSAARNSPHLEFLRKKGIEVLLLTDRVDEWVLSHLQSYDGKMLVSAAKGTLDEISNESEKEVQKQIETELKDIVAKVKEILKDEVKDVRITSRLTDSPSCLVVDSAQMSSHLERLLRQAGQEVPKTKPILELNPEHPLIKKLSNIQDEKFTDLSKILLDQALLAEGATLDNPTAFVKRINNWLALAETDALPEQR